MKEEKQHRESEIQIRDSVSNTGTTLAEVVVIAANPKERKKYDGEMFGITDGGQPIFCIEISNESDLDEKEIAAAVQDEREAEQE